MHHIEVVSQLEGSQLDQLPELIDAATRADHHDPIGEHKFLRLRRGDDLAVAMLAFEEGQLVGYAHTVTFGEGDARRFSCELVVHPEFRRQGVGQILLSRALVHAGDRQARQFDLWAYNDSPLKAQIAAKFGFSPTRRLVHMHRDGHLPPPAVPDAPGAGIRTFRRGVDETALLALNNRIFAGHPENGAWSLDDLEARIAQPWFNPHDVLILEVEGQPSGFCWLKVEKRPNEGCVGEIYVIGIASEYRGRGMARHLLAQGLARLGERRTDVAVIYVDDSNCAALRVYEMAGFIRHHVDVCYTRALRGDEIARNEAAA